MSISQISPNSLTSTNPYANPYSRTTEQQPASIEQANQETQKLTKVSQTDTITFSKQALQMTSANDTLSNNLKNSNHKDPKENFSTKA